MGPDFSLLKRLEEQSIDSKRDTVQDPADDQLQSCFTKALNMALFQAPIQQKSYP